MSNKNGVSAIANEVVGDVQKEAEAAIYAAEQEAKDTLRQAKAHADQNYQEITSQAKIRAEAEKRKIASVTEVEMRNRLLQTKEDLVDVAFQKAQTRLVEFTQSAKYQSYLLDLIGDIAKKMNQKSLVVQVNDKDKEYLTSEVLKRLSKKLDTELNLAEQTAKFVGGCKIHTADDKIIYDGTLDNRLEELKSNLRVVVAKKLFGEEA